MNAQLLAENDSQLIHLPHRQNRAKRTVYGAVTLLAWVVYAYLWLPLLTLLLWVAGVRLSFFELYLRDQRLDAALLVTLPLLLLACAALMIGWAEYNRFRFRGKERRSARECIGDHEVASALHAPEELGTALLGAQSALLTMDPQGWPLAVRVARPMEPATPAVAVIA